MKFNSTNNNLKKSLMDKVFTWEELSQDYEWPIFLSIKKPLKLVKVDDHLTVKNALFYAHQNIAMLWQGSYPQAKRILAAMKASFKTQFKKDASKEQDFNWYRLKKSQHRQLLNLLLLPFDKNYELQLKNSPNLKQAGEWAWGDLQKLTLIPLQQIAGAVSAEQWRLKGLELSQLNKPLYPFYGVFPPSRNEYLDLIWEINLPKHFQHAIEIGVGTGIVSILLALKGIKSITATDILCQAVACAEYNIKNQELSDYIKVEQKDGFPAVTADLIFFNPPWLPLKATTPLEYSVYDYKHRALKDVLQQAPNYLNKNGQLWIVMSDLAELLDLREKEALLCWFKDTGFKVIAKHHVKPKHKKILQSNDYFQAVRAQETVTLWCLGLIED